LAFDNDTGQIQQTDKRCNTSSPSAGTAVPQPQGTVRRMEAISKAFAR